MDSVNKNFMDSAFHKQEFPEIQIPQLYNGYRQSGSFGRLLGVQLYNM